MDTQTKGLQGRLQDAGAASEDLSNLSCLSAYEFGPNLHHLFSAQYQRMLHPDYLYMRKHEQTCHIHNMLDIPVPHSETQEHRTF